MPMAFDISVEVWKGCRLALELCVRLVTDLAQCAQKGWNANWIGGAPGGEKRMCHAVSQKLLSLCEGWGAAWQGLAFPIV